ncbi:hypothetical protein DY000_02039395 [Brassica cretica]|uniref:J domain-containing protein n=1 Tax=Brassica cretica TaxID=69181 RepID=A0ABQ7B9Q3_BRACR|nr:hypothetical protein DY000_02039395 [Brassica cretica]
MFPATSHWFPRINVRDPYKRLGISKMASEDEIQGARNFLIQQYAGHIPSVDAIESAHDKIIMQKFHERKNPKIDITKKVRQVRQSKAVNFVFDAFPVKTAVTFAVLRALTDSAGFVISSSYDWIFYLIVADSDLLDGICDPSVHQKDHEVSK